MHTRIVVVGGGVAGLVATADLARRGLAPVLLEAAPQLGGRAQTRVIDGFCFNQGPHALYVAGSLHAVLDEFGVKVSGGRPDLANGLAIWGDDLQPWPVRRASDEASPPLDREENALLATQLRRIAQGDYDGRGQPLRALTAVWPSQVLKVVEALVRLTSYVHAPNLLDAKAALDQLRLGFAGARYVDGGWAVLVEGLAAAARTAGADLRTERRVSTVVREEVGWRVDVFGEASISCEAVILAVPPSDAIGIAASSKALVAMSSTLRPARMMGLDLGLSPAVRPRASFALGMTAPTYMSVHSEAATLAPEGGALAHLSHYLAPDEAPTAETIDGLERLADDLLPGWRSHETRRQRLVGLTVSHDIPRWEAGGRRSEGRVADAAGLYLAGDWIGDRGMLADAAAASARVAAEQVMTFLSEVQAVTARQASQQTGG
jgi:phytoene dehydrogenase-like protein